MNKLLAAAAALVAVAVVPANAQKFDFSPVKPQAITKAKIKTDLLGFRIEMTRQEATDQLKTLGCKKVTDEYAGALNAIGCALPQGKVKLEFIKGYVNGAETEVVRKVDLYFDSNDGAAKVFGDVSNQFNARPKELSLFGKNMMVACRPGKRFSRTSCGQGDLAEWMLTDDLILTLTMNQAADDEIGRPDNYGLSLFFIGELAAVRARDEFLSQRRKPVATPKF